MSDWKDYLREAVAVAGSQEKLAKGMGCSQAKVSWLLITAATISAEDSIAIHRATAGAVPASALRPDLWRRPEDVPADEPAEAAQ